MKRSHHGGFFYSHDGGIGQRHRRGRSNLLPGKGFLPEERPGVEDRDDRFPALLGQTDTWTLPFSM